MLSEKEKHGIAELLGTMSPPDLVSLAQTVTLRLIVPQSPSEAIATIILHTEKASDLLRRRKVKKDFLFKYLHEKRVEGVDASSDKALLVKHVLQLWESKESGVVSLLTTSNSNSSSGLLSASGSSPLIVMDEDSLPEAPAPSRNTSYSSLCSLDLYTNPGHPHHPPNLAMILNRSQSSSSGNLQTSVEDATGVGMRRSESNWSFMDDSNDGIVLNSQSSQPPPLQALPVNGTVAPNITSQQAQEMADTFVKWYYELINSKSSDFRADHFFPDASAKICLQSHNRSQPTELIQVHNNGSQVCSALTDIVLKYKITYNPNLCTDGVWGVIEPHGLVVVNACGTLHNATTCCGTFQQQFGLVRDPREGNNWKIKFTNANLVSQSSDSTISVGDGVNPQLSSTSSSAMALS